MKYRNLWLLMMASVRPKRRTTRPDYRKLAYPYVPKRRKISKDTALKTINESSTQLFHLKVIDEDVDKELVKVHYVGYDSRFDEWRLKSDVIDLNKNPQSSNDIAEGNSEVTENPEEIIVLNGPVGSSMSVISKPFSLYEELAYRIKSLLFSLRKGDPVCCMSMTFDTIHFDGLIRRGILVKGQHAVYTVTNLTKLDDILRHSWYIRGINPAGDFCYIKPGTVRYQLKFMKGQSDFQILEDGTLQEYTCGQRHQLTFKFFRVDSILSQ